MDVVVRRDWWVTMQLGAVCASLALLGAIVMGLF